jgi:hypothetical protein
MKKVYSLFFICLFFTTALYSQNPIDYSVRVSAMLRESPPQILLHWPKDVNVSNYYIYRKKKTDPLFSSAPIASLTVNDTSYADNNVKVGEIWEYQIIKSITSGKYYGYGYICSGIKAPVSFDAEWRGKIILVYDKAILPALQNEYDRLVLDLVKDGWTVIQHGVNTTDKVTDVHAVIEGEYNNDKANIKAVFLLGHIPVPYSGGDMSFGLDPIDGHDQRNPNVGAPWHNGAWPADIYYGVMNAQWTDEYVTDTVGTYPANHNIPGDGKFDQDVIPAKASIAVGRVDMYDMPAFAPLTEMQLLKRYLDKDHNWRMGLVKMNQRGLVKDYFGTVGGEAFAASGYKNFAPMFGSWNIIDTGTWENNLSKTSYLWSYGTGGGNFSGAGGISSTSNFAKDSLQTVFTMLFGSWFGDWNVTNNYLRAPLASKGPILTDCWSGRPQWQFHQMAMGETIGFSTLLNFNEYGTLSNPTNYFRSSLINNITLRMIHVALMGDPSLRMHVVAPPGPLALSNNKLVVTVNWTASPDPAVIGYYVYKSTGLNVPFTRISTSLVTGTTFTDNPAFHNKSYYMVRAVKLQTSPSGSYYNLSQGSLDTITTDHSGIVPVAGIQPVKIYPNPGKDIFHMVWEGNSDYTGTLTVYDMLGNEVVNRNLNGLDHLQTIDINLAPFEKGVYMVRVVSGVQVYGERVVKE